MTYRNRILLALWVACIFAASGVLFARAGGKSSAKTHQELLRERGIAAYQRDPLTLAGGRFLRVVAISSDGTCRTTDGSVFVIDLFVKDGDGHFCLRKLKP